MILTRRRLSPYLVALRSDGSASTQRLASAAWVLGEEGAGGGVIVDRRGLLLTNCHVVPREGRVRVIFPERRGAFFIQDRDFYWKHGPRLAVEGEVIARAPGADLALIRVDRLPRHAVAARLAGGSPKPGDTLLRVGSPSADGDAWKTTLSRTIWVRPHVNVFASGQRVECRMIHTDAPGRRGDSGGPVFDGRGELVGVHSAGLPGRPLSLAIDVEAVREFISP